MNPKSKFSLRSKESSTLRWLLSFGFFLVLFAMVALLISYGVISLNGTSNSAVAQPAQQPTPAVTASEAPALPAGAVGHAAASPSPQRQ